MVNESVFVFGGGAGEDSKARPHTVKQMLADLEEREREGKGEGRGREGKRTKG